MFAYVLVTELTNITSEHTLSWLLRSHTRETISEQISATDSRRLTPHDGGHSEAETVLLEHRVRRRGSQVCALRRFVLMCVMEKPLIL